MCVRICPQNKLAKGVSSLLGFGLGVAQVVVKPSSFDWVGPVGED